MTPEKIKMPYEVEMTTEQFQILGELAKMTGLSEQETLARLSGSCFNGLMLAKKQSEQLYDQFMINLKHSIKEIH